MKYNLDFNTQYHQFYMADKNSVKEVDEDNFWTEEATESRLAIGDSILGISLECYGHFKGELVILNSKNTSTQFDKFDHVVEGSINIQSGELQILDCPNMSVELKTKIKPGSYRVRIYSANLKSVLDDSGEDYYRIEMWPDSFRGRNVLKQYNVRN